jgi:hypothetical protein
MRREEVGDVVDRGETQQILWRVQKTQGFPSGLRRPHPAKNHSQARGVKIRHCSQIEVCRSRRYGGFSFG